MLELIKKVLMINAAAAVLVVILSQFVPFFASTRLADFLFFIFVIIWVIAKLMWEGSMHSKATTVDDPISDKAYKMVKDHDFKQDLQQNQRQNYQTGLVLFIAGLPAFIGCLILQFV